MNQTHNLPVMNAHNLWSRILTTVGGIAMLVGALDPMEGSLVILPGSALVALGTFLGQSERRVNLKRMLKTSPNFGQRAARQVQAISKIA
jgi:hypothetical protein